MGGDFFLLGLALELFVFVVDELGEVVGQRGAHEGLGGAPPPPGPGHLLGLGLAQGGPLDPEAAPLPPGGDFGNHIGGIGVGDPVRQKAHVPMRQGFLREPVRTGGAVCHIFP